MPVAYGVGSFDSALRASLRMTMPPAAAHNPSGAARHLPLHRGGTRAGNTRPYGFCETFRFQRKHRRKREP